MSCYGGWGEGITGNFVFLILSKSSLLAFYHLFGGKKKKSENMYLVSSSMIVSCYHSQKNTFCLFTKKRVQ